MRARELTSKRLDLLEMTIVTASGEHETLNSYTDPEYFYAVRGGGGSAWGVCLLHPSSPHI